MSGEESELRQRKGAASSSSSANEEREETPEEMRARFSDTIHQVLADMVVKQGRASTKEEIDKCIAEDLKAWGQNDEPKPGIKDDTKKAKDALQKDPYNLEKIAVLGEEYCKEKKWLEAMNVLIRGWKRVAAEKGKSELDDEEQRLAYLFTLCECTMKCQKYRQADHIMRDIEQFCMPQESEDIKEFYIMDCKIHAENDKMKKALEAFTLGMAQCSTFDEKAHVWFKCCASLKKVKADVVGKGIIERSAETEDHKKKLKAFDVMADLTESYDTMPRGTSNYVVVAAAVVMTCLFIYVLWWLEQRSLQSLKFKPL